MLWLASGCRSAQPQTSLGWQRAAAGVAGSDIRLQPSSFYCDISTGSRGRVEGVGWFGAAAVVLRVVLSGDPCAAQHRMVTRLRRFRLQSSTIDG
eukprot:3267209-Rhodomonas_salina.3